MEEQRLEISNKRRLSLVSTTYLLVDSTLSVLALDSLTTVDMVKAEVILPSRTSLHRCLEDVLPIDHRPEPPLHNILFPKDNTVVGHHDMALALLERPIPR